MLRALHAPLDAHVSAPAGPLSALAAAAIPLAHHEEFHRRTTEAQRRRVVRLLGFFDEIRSHPSGVLATCRRLAAEYPGRGYSWQNLRTLYYAWRHTGDWRTLVPQYRGPAPLPAAFVAMFRRRVEQNRRERPARAVMQQLKAEWAAGSPIDGYGTWRDWYATQYPERDVPARYPFGFFPRGWSQSNLYTKQPSKAERALARRGFAAAQRHLPHLVRDTAALRPMELVTIDDFETDILVQARHPRTGRLEICPCTGLLALDVATRRHLALGLKPRFRDEAGARLAIARADVQGLLHAMFAAHGLPRDHGVTILCENAAAAIGPEFETALQTLLGVQVARTGLLAAKVLPNGFVERGGKPWEKGWIESAFHLAWNHAGAFPGQKGATYQLRPGDLEARLLYAEKLLATDALDAAQRAELATGFWPFDAALAAYRRVFDFMERRTAHRMQGFEEVHDYALPDGSGLVTADEAQRLPRAALLACTPVPRRESPRERWDRLTRDMAWVRPAEHALALLLLAPRKVKLANHRLSFVYQGNKYTFADADSPAMKLPEGTELLGYFDPAAADKLWVTRLDGRLVGPVRRRGPVDLRDPAAIAAEQGEIARLVTECVLAPVRARHAGEDRALAELQSENARQLEALERETRIAEREAAERDRETPAVNLPSTNYQLPTTPPPAAEGSSHHSSLITRHSAARASARRRGLSAQLARATPAAQPHHAAAADALAGAIAADTALQAAGKRAARARQRATTLDATKLF